MASAGTAAGGPALVVLAAGMGSRFGGPKQLAAVGPSGETLIEYGLFDAWRAGFRRFVFVLREAIKDDFRSAVLQRFVDHLECDVVLQRPDDFPQPLPEAVLRERTKPWGTAHALWAARHAVAEGQPVGVMNGDDFYGPESFSRLARLLGAPAPTAGLVSFRLDQTLSTQGGVSRGICTVDAAGRLVAIEEGKRLQRAEQENAVVGVSDQSGAAWSLPPETPVSMNLMGFSGEVWSCLRGGLEAFVAGLQPGSAAEFGLPDLLSRWMADWAVAVAQTPERWIGVTHRSDLEPARAAIRQRVEAGQYPETLWSQR